MKIIIALIGATFLLGTSAASGQPAPADHEQHQRAANPEPAMKGGCCCEKDMAEMKSMMAEMMKMHRGMKAHQGAAAEKPQAKDEHSH